MLGRELRKHERVNKVADKQGEACPYFPRRLNHTEGFASVFMQVSPRSRAKRTMDNSSIESGVWFARTDALGHFRVRKHDVGIALQCRHVALTELPSLFRREQQEYRFAH